MLPHARPRINIVLVRCISLAVTAPARTVGAPYQTGLVRAQIGTRWTTWYNLGVWAADTGTVQRHSGKGQEDADGAVAVDTRLLDKSNPPATALQLRLRLFTATALFVPRPRRRAP